MGVVMQGLIASAVLIFALFSGQPTDAATAGEPAYRTAILGQNSPWQEGLLLEFAPDERVHGAPTRLRHIPWQERRYGYKRQAFASSAGPLAVARWHKPCLFAGRRPQPFPEYNLQRKSGKSLQAGFDNYRPQKSLACNNAACRSHDRRQALD